jgi:hypothetical protein
MSNVRPQMNIACIAPYLSLAKDVILTGAAVAGAWVAVRGLSTWNRQLRGGVEYDLTRRLLRTTYQLREAIKGVRNPVMWAAEMPVPPEEERAKLTRDQIHHYGQARAYQLRWDKVTEIRNELQTELLEAEVLWGKETHRKYESLFKFQQELFVTIHAYLRACDPDRPEESRRVTQQVLEKRRDVMYDLSGETPDEFGQDVAAAIISIEEFLKPHLRK